MDSIPWSIDLKKFACDSIPIDEKCLSNSFEATYFYMSNQIHKFQINKTVEKSKFTFDEAIEGIDGEEFLNSIKRSSSPGYPFVFDNKWKNKVNIFGPGPDFQKGSEMYLLLQSQVKEIIENAKKGIRLRHVFTDTLKDERKPVEKAHKTRMFSACPLDYLIACKQYFMGVVSLIQKSRNYCGISVGTNAYSEDWNDIVKILHRKSEHIIAGDFEGFDSSQQQVILRKAGQILIDLAKEFLEATEEDCLVMSVLLESLFTSVHCNKDILYMWLKGLPSGHFLTAIINSIFVLISFCNAWQACFGPNLLQAFNFFKYCGIVAYGDDHLVSVPKQFLNFFNQMTLPKFMLQFGLTYTMEEKDKIAEEQSRRIDEVSYLKRGFLWDEDYSRYIGPLSIDTILETPQWIKKTPDPETQTFIELENSIKELSLHPTEVWNQWADKFDECFHFLGQRSEFQNKLLSKQFVLTGLK